MKLRIAYGRKVERTSPPVVEESKEIYPPGLYALVQGDVVCEFNENPFDVASPLKWVPVDKDQLDSDEINPLDQPDKWEYKDGQVVKKEDEIEKVISNVKGRVSTKLSTTDWMVIREADGGTAMPSNIKTWRASVRTKANDMCTQIDNAADVDALAALYEYTNTGTEEEPVFTRPLGEFPELD